MSFNANKDVDVVAVVITSFNGTKIKSFLVTSDKALDAYIIYMLA